jgi:hypothetical protein
MNEITIKDLNISNTQKQNLNFFWIGYCIYIVAYCLTATVLYFKLVQLQALMFIGILLFLYGAMNIIKFRLKEPYLKNIFIVYMLWLVSVLVRGMQPNPAFIKELMVDPGYGLFIYFVPLVLLFPQNFAFYRKMFDIILILGLFYVLLSGIFIKHVLDPDRRSTLAQGVVENFSMLSYPVFFVVLTYLYHEKKRKIFALGLTALMLLFAVYRARRGMIFMCVSTFLFCLMVYLIVSKKTFMVIYLAIIIAVVGALFYSSLYNQSNFGIFTFLVERGDEDTRTGVEVAFEEDMSQTQWIIGKGVAGDYYCPGIDAPENWYRSVIETGYLQIILKGGIVSLVLLLSLIVPAMIKGMFYSKNILSKASGIWLLLWIFYLYPTVSNGFTMHYMIVWTCVGICYNKKIRQLTDGQVKEFLNDSKKSKAARKFNLIQSTATAK